jgi:hypothetical protein
MAEINNLNPQQKQFLAGAIKSLILADGQIEETELTELDKLNNNLHFTDFEESLDQFEKVTKSQEKFWEMAETMTDSDYQTLVIQTLFDLSLQSGRVQDNEQNLINQLKELWNI